MRNLLIGTTLAIMATQESHALPDNKILETIEHGIANKATLCKKLDTLDAKDKKRLEDMICNMNPQTDVEKKAAMLGRKHNEIHKCIDAWPHEGLDGAL